MTNNKKSLPVGKKLKSMAPEAIDIITKIAYQNNKYFDVDFNVIERKNCTFKDIEEDDNLKFIAPEEPMPWFSEDTPKEIIDLVLETYQCKKKYNGLSLAVMVPIELLVAAKCQRPLDSDLVRKIVNDFDVDQFTPIKLVYINGSFYLEVADGQHHLASAIRRGFKFVPGVIAINKTEEEIADMFGKQTQYKKNLNYVDKIVAGVQSRQQLYLELIEACNKMRVKLASTTSYSKTIKSAGAAIKIVKSYGAVGLMFVFQLLFDAGWENDPQAYEEWGLNVGLAALQLIEETNGNFNYKNYLKLIKYDSIREYLDMINKKLKTWKTSEGRVDMTSSKHPETHPIKYAKLVYYSNSQLKSAK